MYYKDVSVHLRLQLSMEKISQSLISVLQKVARNGVLKVNKIVSYI